MAFVAADYHANAHQAIFSLAPCLQVFSDKLISSWARTKQMNHTHIGLQEVSHDQIQALCQQGHLQRALYLLFTTAIPPPERIYLSLIKACKKEKALVHAQHIYAHLSTHPSKKLSSVLGNYLVLTFVTCGSIDIAYQVFQQLKCVTSSSWMSIISGFVESGQALKALEMYNYMLHAQVEPNTCTLVNLLKVCGSIHDLDDGKKLHSDAVERGYHVDVFVGSTLVSMYGKCRSLPEAENVFGSLMQRNIVSWNAMLMSCVEDNMEEKALSLYRQMQEEGVSPNHVSLVAALQACGTLGIKELSDTIYLGAERKSAALEIGRALHADARKRGLATSSFVQSALLSMYRKCDSLAALEAVFISLSDPNVVSWNVILTAYAEQGQEKKALQLYRKMQEERVIPDHQTLMAALIACRCFVEKEGAICLARSFNKAVTYELCRALQFDAWSNGLAFDVIMGSLLISIYGKCRTIAEAEDVFGHLLRPDVVAWNAMLSAYVEQAQEEKAYKLYRQMQEEGVCLDELTLITAFQTCSSFAGKEGAGFEGRCSMTIALEIGKALHSAARKHGFESIVHVGNTLLSMYGKCGCITHAEIVFGRLLMRDIVSWNGMLAVYVENGQYEFALRLYRQLRREGYAPDELTFAITLQACGIAADEATPIERQSRKGMPLKLVRALHSEALMKGFGPDKCTQSRLISIYGKCGMIMEAENIFFRASQSGTVCWNAMLLAYVEHNQAEKALQLYKQMQEQNFVDERTVVIALKACGSILKKEEAVIDGLMISAICLEIGLCLHAYACKNAFDLNVFVGSTLISMYSKCRCISRAEHVFDRMPKKNKILWNTMLSAYVEYGEGERALQLFRVMQKECENLDGQTLTIVLQACCVLAEKEAAVVMEGQPIKACSLRIGQALHAEAAQSKEFSMDVFVASTLVSLYGKCGAIREAEMTFCCLPEQNTLSWNAMLSAYAEYDHWEKALQLYGHIEKMHMVLDDVTLFYILQASSQTGSVEVCRRVHFILFSSKTCLSSLLVTTLVHAYGNCGCMLDAEAVFHDLAQPDVVTWSTCVSGFAQQGNSEASFYFLNEMHIEGIMPDEVTSCSFLSACSHTGLVDEGVYYFDCMSRNFGLTPDVKHYTSVIDLFARAGNLAKVEYMLQKMPIKADLAIWTCVLSACCLHGDLGLAKLAFSSAMQLQPSKSAEYTLMSNIYWQLDPIKDE